MKSRTSEHEQSQEQADFYSQRKRTLDFPARTAALRCSHPPDEKPKGQQFLDCHFNSKQESCLKMSHL